MKYDWGDGDPIKPVCEDGRRHDWQSPHALVGGLESNPGVLGLGGGGIVINEACIRCGCRRRTAVVSRDGKKKKTVSYWASWYDLDDMGFTLEERNVSGGRRWVVLDRNGAYTIAGGWDDAREIAYQCRAGRAARYHWIDE